ncbi:hypothetical protein BO82DRAFT_389479 [Aspergillus uvarum CBS 121591]|uniref:Zn(2)-C6 fungal-type domain-containing protein n=1 Tax=Aspergillus uvarum CBS 121591 TaxID=1448315 RepID=A0A319CHV6_9EURO|nr:hypothetical protein BO82DRAFT_389479 [Aspergillus uvarum CBS 121591]PYH85356.1 hypothetical protein BO82DRAFT_389479 [Aspergillus uvarum CBS 121591]
MPVRRFHRKSRSGCLQCRSRRVKCDEGRPACFNCIRAQCSCLYHRPTQGDPQSQSQAQAQAQAHSQAQLQPQLVPSLSPSPFPSPANTVSRPLFDSLDLILMNHFTAATSLSLFDGPRNPHLWQRHIPFEAGSNPMLMHGLLAVAALHLAITIKSPLEAQPSDHTYHVRALHHHSLGLQLFNTQLASRSPANDVLFTFAMLLIVWAFAAPIAANDTLTLDEIIDSLSLIRGCKALFLLHQETILYRPVGQIVGIRPQQADPGPCASDPSILSDIHDLFDNLQTIACDDTVYQRATFDLQTVVYKAYNRQIGLQDTRLVAAWPANVSEEYWARLRRHEPVALRIFIHYTVLLQCYEEDYWWMQGWSSSILKAAEGAQTLIQRDRMGWEWCYGKIVSLRDRRASGAQPNPSPSCTESMHIA